MNHFPIRIIVFIALLLPVEANSLSYLASATEETPKLDEVLSSQQTVPPGKPGQQDGSILLEGGVGNEVPQMERKPEEQGAARIPVDNLPPDADEPGREKRSPKFEPLPNGDLCLLSTSSGEVYYEFTDEAGMTCRCELCLPGRILDRNCTCDPSALDIPQRTQCRLVEEGKQYMPVHSKCETGIDCRECVHPRVENTQCSATADRSCACVGYSVDGTDCTACDVNEEPTWGDGDQHNIIVCRPCPEGFQQPNRNSTDRCRKVTETTQTPTVPEKSPSLRETTTTQSSGQLVTEQSIPDQSITPVPNSTTVIGNSTTGVGLTPPSTEKWCLSSVEFSIAIVVSLFVGGAVTWLCMYKRTRRFGQRHSSTKSGNDSETELGAVVTHNGEGSTDESSASSSNNNQAQNASKRPGGKHARKRRGKQNSI